MKIKNKCIAFAIAFAFIVSNISFVQAAVDAKPTTSKIYVNGEQQSCAAYYINGNNYFKLRDLAYALNGTSQEFSVEWDEQRHVVILTSGQRYQPVGGEMEAVKNEIRSANITSSNIIVDGQTINVQGYNIDNSVYFKLRDITNIFGISVIWNDKNNTINIETGQRKANERNLTAKEIYNRCNSAIFYIKTYDIDGDALSSGSGFFIDKNGKAVTNFHVLENAYTAVITMADGIEYNVKGVLGYDMQGDLAILQVDGNNFPFLSAGDSDEVTSGEKIYAIGSPLGLSNTISEGIVSGINRTIKNIPYIQITAAISHGSSGGALLNEKGQVIGVTSAEIATGQNLNFAIPINAVFTLDTNSLYTFAELVEEYTIKQYNERSKPLEKIVLEEEPNDLLEFSQIIESGDSIMGEISSPTDLDNYAVFCGSSGVLEIYCYSDAEDFDKVALLAEDMYGEIEMLGEFAEMEDGKTGIYLLMPILEPGYYHFMLGLQEIVPEDTKMDYLFYYQFTPEGAEW
ncbi:trypsin-like peptidase domain-containing protein [Clostridium sp. MD294]|uniref:trypsin-like peptidase domain-containing protein n=1 Tax=Clostridium sp. MD294 TaxID=97138 RepID=UPI0002CAD1BE|nr:trypsin-like peptidase domain-containing protein [Clostridium sp. MD294]NDO47718.1 trypsin-like serine protease [Clostridium sp. MD294]USF29964.1 hypothetical protein C820_001387 [Clostridium sp. MD294]